MSIRIHFESIDSQVKKCGDGGAEVTMNLSEGKGFPEILQKLATENDKMAALLA